MPLIRVDYCCTSFTPHCNLYSHCSLLDHCGLTCVHEECPMFTSCYNLLLVLVGAGCRVLVGVLMYSHVTSVQVTHISYHVISDESYWCMCSLDIEVIWYFYIIVKPKVQIHNLKTQNWRIYTFDDIRSIESQGPLPPGYP